MDHYLDLADVLDPQTGWQGSSFFNRPNTQELAQATGVLWSKMTRIMAAVIVGSIAFVPMGLFLQWWLPQDGPAEIIVLLASLPSALIGIVLIRLAHKRISLLSVLRLAGYSLLIFFLWVQIFVLFPGLSRRIGPWATLKSMLVEASQEIEVKREELRIPSNRPLTAEEFERLR